MTKPISTDGLAREAIQKLFSKRQQGRTLFVEFHPDWLDKKGLPTKAINWGMEMLQIGQNVSGVRYGHHEILEFTIARKSNGVSVQMEMEGHKFLVGGPRLIEVRYRNTTRVIESYEPYTLNGELTWLLVYEDRRVQHDTGSHLPVYLASAHQLFTRLVRKRISADVTLCQKWDWASAVFGVSIANKLKDEDITPPAYEQVLAMLVKVCKDTSQPRPTTSDAINEFLKQVVGVSRHLLGIEDRVDRT